MAATPTLAQEPLLLVMPVKLDKLGELKQKLLALKAGGGLADALDRVGTVHSTRFVILEEPGWAKLIVVAIYDGTPESYIGAFARELSLPFNMLFECVSDAPPLPVERNVQTFVDYVKAHDVKSFSGENYLANPGLTVLDIWEEMVR
jgi:hypothetical protein